LDIASASARPDSAPASAAGGFGQLLAVRALTVVNDNLLRWLAIGLGKHAAGVAGTALVLTVGTAGFVLPFVVLAWLAGWLADRFPKPRVIAWCKFAEVLIAVAAAGVLVWDSRAGGAFSGWNRVGPAAGALIGLAVAGWLASLFLRRRGAADETAPPPWNALRRTRDDLRDLFRARELAASAAGIVFFWALGAVAQLNIDQYVAEGGATAQSQAVPMLLALIVGIGLGSLVAGKFTIRSTDLGFVPVGAGIMAVASLGLAVGPAILFGDGHALAWWTAAVLLAALGFGAGMFDVPLEAYFQAVSPASRRGSLLAALNLLTFVGMLVASLVYGLLRTSPAEPTPALPPGLWLLLGSVILIGCQAALMAPSVLGSIPETVPAGGIANANGVFAMVTLAATLLGMAAGNWLADQPGEVVGAAAAQPLVSARGVFGIFAALSAAAAGAAVYCAPRASVRMAIAGIVHGIWKYRARGAENVPETGPVVVVANHLSWLDGFLLPLSCPRPLRMVVYGPNIQGRFLRMLADQWRFILFDPRPKSIGQALKSIQSGLADGDAIGIFCEGGISRTGQLLGFKRGLEWLLEKVEAPIVPAAIDGLWGSGLTFSEGRYFTKRPRFWRRSISLTYGRPLPIGTHPDQARLALQEIAAESVSGRLDPHAATAEAFDGCCLVRRDDRLLASLAVGDPLHESLGSHAGRLLGIAAVTSDATTAAGDLAAALVREQATIWLARIEQVAAVAADPAAARLGQRLAVVVMPIATAADLPRARQASAAFQAATGVEPVVAYAPREIGGLVAMNTPPSRVSWDHETVSKPDTVGRVVNGVVVWPRGAMRQALNRPSLASVGIPDDASGTLAIAASGVGRGGPKAAVLADSFDVDKEGFLVARG
jgi:1-acyl-sn-glycerol-3-phosphate acyltransferase